MIQERRQKKTTMKRNSTLTVIIMMLLTSLMLTACGKSEFGAIGNNEKGMTITAKNAGKDDFFMVGTLEADEGEMIVITGDLTKGQIRVEISAAPEEGMEELPDMDKEPIIISDMEGKNSQSGTVPAGNYMVKATCLEKATGTVTIEVKPAA